MRKRVFLTLLILVIVSTSLLTAASKGAVGIVGYTNWNNLAGANDPEGYLGGIRAEFFLNDYLGISGDAMMLASDSNNEEFLMLYMLDAVGRIPLGFVEPYVALGPNFMGVLGGDDTSTVDFGFNTRLGVDFNILDHLSLGIETNFLVDKLEDFFDDFESYLSADGIKERGLIGITIKYKF